MFGGWYSDSSLETPYTFTSIPSKKIVLFEISVARTRIYK